MAKSMDVAVAEMLGQQQLRIAALIVQVEELQEQLAAAKQAAEPKASKLHEVQQR